MNISRRFLQSSRFSLSSTSIFCHSIRSCLPQRVRRLHLPTECKAITMEGFGGPEVLTYSNITIPQPGPDQVLVKVHARYYILDFNTP